MPSESSSSRNQLSLRRSALTQYARCQTVFGDVSKIIDAAVSLAVPFGRGFSRRNPQHMRLFYLAYPPDRICQTVSGKLLRRPQLPILQTPSGESESPSAEVGFDDLLSVRNKQVAVVGMLPQMGTITSPEGCCADGWLFHRMQLAYANHKC